MDACRFINSKDVAEHFRAAGHQFNAFETVYFVEQLTDATLDEKISAWTFVSRRPVLGGFRKLCELEVFS